MTSNQIVVHVIGALEQLHVPYMMVGAYSANVYGIERSTQDADFVIELKDDSISKIAKLLAPEIVVDQQLSFESVTLSQRYVAKHQESEFKIEFFLLSSEPFHQSRFARRINGPFLSIKAWIQSPEDLIIQKLRWHSRAKRSKDIDDATNVLAVQFGKLDYDYIRKWCSEHGTLQTFEALYEESKRFAQ